ncbi:MAG: hypothetical protein ACRDAS_01890 [Cetobacterium sp.]
MEKKVKNYVLEIYINDNSIHFARNTFLNRLTFESDEKRKLLEIVDELSVTNSIKWKLCEVTKELDNRFNCYEIASIEIIQEGC